MAARRPRKRKTTVVVPGGGGSAATPPPPVPAAARFHTEVFEDGSVRPVRNRTKDEAARDQAMADFFGVPPILSPRANVRTMESLLAEITGHLNLAEMDFAPELLASAWAKAVGPFLANRAELVGIAKQTATIRTDHPAVRFELNNLKPQIVRVLNNVLGEGSVRSVRIVHG